MHYSAACGAALLRQTDTGTSPEVCASITVAVLMLIPT